MTNISICPIAIDNNREPAKIIDGVNLQCDDTAHTHGEAILLRATQPTLLSEAMNVFRENRVSFHCHGKLIITMI